MINHIDSPPPTPAALDKSLIMDCIIYHVTSMPAVVEQGCQPRESCEKLVFMKTNGDLPAVNRHRILSEFHGASRPQKPNGYAGLISIRARSFVV